MGKWLALVLAGSLTAAGCGTAPATAPATATTDPVFATQSLLWGGLGLGSRTPSSGLEAYFHQHRASQTNWGGVGPFSWNSYYPNWAGPLPYYAPPIYRTTVGPLTYVAAPVGPWPLLF